MVFFTYACTYILCIFPRIFPKFLFTSPVSRCLAIKLVARNDCNRMCPISWRVACSTLNCKPYGARHPGDLSVLSNFARAAASCPQPQPKRRNRRPPPQRTAGSEIAAAAYGGMLPDVAAALLHQQNVTSDCHVMSHHACTCMPLARHKLRSYRVGTRVSI